MYTAVTQAQVAPLQMRTDPGWPAGTGRSSLLGCWAALEPADGLSCQRGCPVDGVVEHPGQLLGLDQAGEDTECPGVEESAYQAGGLGAALVGDGFDNF